MGQQLTFNILFAVKCTRPIPPNPPRKMVRRIYGRMWAQASITWSLTLPPRGERNDSEDAKTLLAQRRHLPRCPSPYHNLINLLLGRLTHSFHRAGRSANTSDFSRRPLLPVCIRHYSMKTISTTSLGASGPIRFL